MLAVNTLEVEAQPAPGEAAQIWRSEALADFPSYLSAREVRRCFRTQSGDHLSENTLRTYLAGHEVEGFNQVRYETEVAMQLLCSKPHGLRFEPGKLRAGAMPQSEFEAELLDAVASLSDPSKQKQLLKLVRAFVD